MYWYDISVKSYYRIDQKFQRKRAIRKTYVFLACLGIICLAIFMAIFRVPQSDTEANVHTQEQASLSSPVSAAARITEPLPWPDYGYSAYGAPKDNFFASSSEENVQVPIASLAKVITVLAILEKKPLALGEQGPLIQLDAEDVALAEEYARKDGMYVPVLEGEGITQLQALQAVLLVSANNMTDSMARWAFGSVEAYTQYANQMLKNYGIKDTIVADASGFSPQTVSTAVDMTKIGYIYMKHPVLRALASQEHATIPVAGQLKNYNSFANDEGIIGIKVGNTDEAKRTFLAASIRKDDSKNEEISIAAILGAETLQVAAQDAVRILKAGDNTHTRLKESL